jgi:protein SHQ1
VDIDSCLDLLENPKAIYLGLLDLLFAYAYNHRTTEGENTVESGWTICKLSPTLVNMEVHETLMECCISSIRRVLTFPLYRNYDLALKCLKDVVVILKLGKRACLKALLEIKFLLDRHEAAYVLSRLWLDDYCVWIQQAR